MSRHKHSWAWQHWSMCTHESLWIVMSMAQLGHGPSLALMSAYGAIAPYTWVLISAPERSWTLMTAPESWRHDYIINKKMFTLKINSCNILPISRSTLNQNLKNRIFSKSTQNGLLKIVQDGLSSHLGGREIWKTKALTVLPDTLYIYMCMMPVYVSVCVIQRAWLLDDVVPCSIWNLS